MHRLIINGELVLFGTVGEIFLFSEDYFSALDVVEALAQMQGNITVRLNSIGGLADQGTAIYHALRNFPGQVTIVIEGMAASAASLVAMAGNRIVMRKGAQLMIHDPARNTSDRGTAAEHQKTAEDLEKQAVEFADIYAARAGMDAKSVRAMMIAETYMTADEAVKFGFADEVSDGNGQAATMVDIALNDNAPSFLFRISRAVAAMMKSKAAPAAQPLKETSMTLEQLIAMLAARFGNSAEDVKMLANQAMMAGIDLAALTALIKDTATIAAAKDAVKAKVTEMLGAPAPTSVPALITLPTTMTVADTRDIMSRAATAGLDLAQTNTIMAASTTREAAFSAIIDMVAERSKPAPTASAHVTQDARDKFREGATRALMMKIGLENGERNEFSGLSLVEMARSSLVVGGVSGVNKLNRMLMVGAAFTGEGLTMIGGMHSTSDFAYILQNVANKSALKGFQEAPETFQLWTSKGQTSDFKTLNRVDLGLFPTLEKVAEGAEFKYAKLGDRGVAITIDTYGKLVAITRQAIINDDMSILNSVPKKMGQAAKRTIGNLAYGMLNANVALADGVALFHATHGNLLTAAAPTEASFQAATKAMQAQQDNEKNAIALNIQPKYFLSSAYQFTAKQLLESTGSISDGKSAAVVNTVQGLVTPITDARITGNSWFFAADPNQVDTVEITYLDGVEEPTLETKDGWTIDGTELKTRLDVGVNVLDFRGLQKNAGL